MTRDEEQSREVVQRVFVEVLAQWSRIADVREPRAWLAQVTRNQCGRLWRESSRAPVPMELDDAALQAGVWRDDAPDPESAALQARMRVAFLRAFHERLHDEEQTVIQMRYLSPEVDPSCEDAQTVDQLAQELGVAHITVRRRLDRARAKLREALAAEGFSFGAFEHGDDA